MPNYYELISESPYHHVAFYDESLTQNLLQTLKPVIQKLSEVIWT